MERREFLSLPLFAAAAPSQDPLRQGWLAPPRSCRPHTRWWWPGSAVTRAGISSQLEAMKQQGIGGVEIMSCWEMYERGNLTYLSPEWEAMIRHAIAEAKRLDMEVALTFGPGWDFGGAWVPPAERSKALAPAWADLQGPAKFSGELPALKLEKPSGFGFQDNPSVIEGDPPDEGQLVAVVAGRWDGKKFDGASLVDLTAQARNGRLEWAVPEGSWRVVAFRLKYTGQQNSAQNYVPRNYIVDHFSRPAMQHHFDYLAARFQKMFGAETGKTVDSFFADSFEIVPLPGTVLWSNQILAEFHKQKGYDLTPWLPAIWWDIGEKTPQVRYDLNECLHQVAMEATIRPFDATCRRLGAQARVQPHYRFAEEVIEGAGAVERPETEVTTARFETVPDPRKATVAGARFYGRTFVSAEAYTFIHPERYRATLEEMKIATDAFLRDGITQFYNHGWLYTPESEVAPMRDMPWADRISPWNPWWKHYRHLAAYVARSCWMLRQGDWVGDVLLFTPQAQAWTQKAVWGIERRVMPYGDLPKTLVANGYDYDPVNSDVLENRMRFENGVAKIGRQEYRALILPRITDLPLATMRAIAAFARGGGMVIAVDVLPQRSTGLMNFERDSVEVRALAAEIFERQAGGSRFLADYRLAPVQFVSNEQPYHKTPPLREGQRQLLKLLGERIPPDFDLGAQSDGLTFHHRRAGDTDIYFVTNLQPEAIETDVRFRTGGKRAERWDPMDASVTPLGAIPEGARTRIPLRLDPWESLFVVFRPGAPDVPQPAPQWKNALTIDGPWDMELEGVRFPRRALRIDKLADWKDDPATRHFSGTGIYRGSFAWAGAPGLVRLDLGVVGCVAEVLINGKPAGTRILRPYRFDVSKLLVRGRNRIEIRVTNLLIHHVQGMTGDVAVPAALEAHYGKAIAPPQRSITAFERDRKFQPLGPSGLIGPVSLLVESER